MSETALPGFPRPGALPYLTVPDARDAIAWYADVFGAELVADPYLMPDERIGHAELALAGGSVYLADPFPDLGLTGPAPDRVAVSLMVAVEDTDATLERARRAGADRIGEPYDEYGGRNASFVDPFGHRWMLYGPASEDATTAG